MVLAVRGLSPVIITVRMPMARRRSKRSLMPGLTTSFSSTSPMTSPSAVTASGVEPWEAIMPTASLYLSGSWLPWDRTYFATASLAPLR